MLLCLMMTVAGGLAPHAAGESLRKATMVVRADPHSGRLVRSVVVTPRVVAPKAVAASSASPPAPIPPEAGVDVRQLVEETARKYQVDPLLVHSVIQVESGYNRFAVSYKGAEGLMQLMPSTARRFGVRNSFNAASNIEGGVRYLKYLQDLFGDPRKVLAAYNAGEAAVSKHGSIPPYRETWNYVYQVAKKWGQAREAARRAEQSQRADTNGSGAAEYRPVETQVDSEGKLYIRTR